MTQAYSNSDSGGDKSPERPQNRLETKAENKERGETSKHIADGELNKDISAQTLEKRLSRKSGATGYGVASADSLLPTEAEIQKLGKQLTAKLEQEKPIAVIAQNIGDSNPFNPLQPQVMTDATNAKSEESRGNLKIGDQQYSPDDVLAGPLEDIRDNAARMGLPHFGKEDHYVDYATARQAVHLAGLDKYKIPEDSIGAILRNEQHFYKITDEAQDKEAATTGTVLKDGKENSTASIGPAQMQIANTRHLIAATDEHGKPKYPFLQHMKDDPIRGSLDKHNAALLAGAYLANKIEELRLKPADVNAKCLAYIYNEDVHSYGSPKQYVACDDPISLNVQQKLHPDLKNEHYPTADVLKHSIHVHNVMESLDAIQKNNKPTDSKQVDNKPPSKH